MKKLLLRILTITLSLITVFAVMNCDFSSSKKKSSSSDVKKSDAEAIDNSMVTMPNSLKSNETSKGDTRGAVADDSYLSRVYEGVPKNIAIADDFNKDIKKVITYIISHEVLKNTPKGTIYRTSKKGLKKIKLEDSDMGYKYKLTLYFTENEETTNVAVIRFTVEGDKAKGLLLANRTLPLGDLTADGITDTTLSVTNSLSMTFDGTGGAKEADFKFTSDLSKVIAYANSSTTTLTETQLKKLKVFSPAVLYFKAKNDETTGLFTIYGASYHPGWSKVTASVPAGVRMLNNTERNMYMFKAAAKESSVVNGALVSIAFPVDSGTSSASIFSGDTIDKTYPVEYQKIIDSTTDTAIKSNMVIAKAAIKNPGYFTGQNSTSLFLGTYSSEDSKFWKAGTPWTKDDNADKDPVMKSIKENLTEPDNSQVFVPNDIKNAVITIE